MSNVLQPLASRYSLFFTVALFDSSRICQSRHPTKTVQDMVLEAQERYERLDRKQARHKLRALLRNVSMASTSSDSTTTSSSTHTTTMTVNFGSCLDTTVEFFSTEQSSVDPSLSMPSFPPALATANADASGMSDTALAESDPTAETVSTTVSPPSSSPTFSDNCNQQRQSLVSAEAVTPSSSLSLSSSFSNKLARAIKRKAKQLRHNSRTSIATLLSITLTTLFLSMLQRRRHRLTVLARKGVLLVRTPSRQAQQLLCREMNSCDNAQEHTQQQQPSQQLQYQHYPLLRQQSHNRCEALPRRDNPGRLRLYRRGTLVSSTSSSSFFSFSSPLSPPTRLSSSPSQHQIVPPSFNMIASASATSASPIPHHTHSTKEAYVSAWLQHQNLHDRATWGDHHSNGAEPNHSNYPSSPVYNQPSSNNSTNLRHRRSISLMDASEFEDEIRQSQPELQSKQQQHPPQSSQKQKRHSSAPTHANSKGPGSGSLHLSSPAAANLASTHMTTTSKSKKHRRHKSLHESCSRSPEELAWDSHYYYQRQQREEQVYQEEQHRLARLRGTAASLAMTPGTASTTGLYRHSSHPLETSHSSSFSAESFESAVARAKSLNRLTAPALLSRETSKALGICRSDTLSTDGKSKTPQEKEPSNSRPVSPPPSPLQMLRDRSHTLNFNSWDQYRGAPSTPPTSGLKHKKTLKEHLTPSFRSLASRFGSGSGSGGGGSGSGNGCSTRPSSVADLLSFDNGSSRSATPTPSSNRHSISGGSGGSSGHLLDFKPLKAGPETVEHLRRCSLEQQHRPVSTDVGGAAFERRTAAKLTHRRGSSLSCSQSPLEGDGRVLSNHGKNHGHGEHNDNVDDDDEDEDEDERENIQGGETGEFPEGVFNFEEHPSSPSSPTSSSSHCSNGDSMKKQILTLLSIRRKSKSSLKSTSTSTTMMAASPMCLSPLELEAQEDPWDEDDDDEDDDEDDDDDDDETEELYGHRQETPHPFDFMLVPKAQYEFQPLVM